MLALPGFGLKCFNALQGSTTEVTEATVKAQWLRLQWLRRRQQRWAAGSGSAARPHPLPASLIASQFELDVLRSPRGRGPAENQMQGCVASEAR